jgi:hypothetical protein
VGERILSVLVVPVQDRGYVNLYHLETLPLAVVEWNNDFNVTRWSKKTGRLIQSGQLSPF